MKPPHPAELAPPPGAAGVSSWCDVLVVGGGINGAGIARDLAGRGLAVLLVERDDLAQHTSSASTKLIHGGLRYLEQYEFSLVRKALAEREVLLKSAPHIMRPLRFVMPHDPSMRPAWMIRVGLFLYDHLARRELLPSSGAIDLRRHPAGAPLKREFSKGFVYSDGWVDDARLVVLAAIDAAARGATVRTRCACEHVERSDGGWLATLRDAGGTPHQVRSRALVNAAGPWAAQFLREHAGIDSARGLRLVKGSHIVVRKLFDHDHAYIFQNRDGRIVFAIPYEGDFTLIGTTDVEHLGAIGGAAIDAGETAYLCKQASRYFERAVVPADVVWSYSGVRPLLDDESSHAHAVTRDYLLELDSGGRAEGARGGPPAAGPPQGGRTPSGGRAEGPGGGPPAAGPPQGGRAPSGGRAEGPGGGPPAAGPPQGGHAPSGGRAEGPGGPPLLSVWGGKITTFRKLAEEAADQLCAALGHAGGAWTAGALLPGGDLRQWIGPPRRPDTDFARFDEALATAHPHWPAELRQRLARCYGARITLLLAAGGGSLGPQVAPGLHEAELHYLQQHEWACSTDDVLWRRTKLGLHLDAAGRAQVDHWWQSRAATRREPAWS